MTALNDFTSEQVATFHIRLADRVGGVRFVKASLPQELTDLIARCDLPAAALAQRPFALHDTVVLPYAPGRSPYRPAGEVRIAVHECTHVLRIRAYPGSVFQWYREYFTNPGFRALEEASAEVAVGQLEYWRCGTFPPINLVGYALSEDMIVLAVTDHRDQCEGIRALGRGATTGRESAARAAIAILTDMGVTPA